MELEPVVPLQSAEATATAATAATTRSSSRSKLRHPADEDSSQPAELYYSIYLIAKTGTEFPVLIRAPYSVAHLVYRRLMRILPANQALMDSSERARTHSHGASGFRSSFVNDSELEPTAADKRAIDAAFGISGADHDEVVELDAIRDSAAKTDTNDHKSDHAPSTTTTTMTATTPDLAGAAIDAAARAAAAAAVTSSV
jgi:hypothetical protein